MTLAERMADFKPRTIGHVTLPDESALSLAAQAADVITAQAAVIDLVGAEGYIHGFICVRPPCGPKPGTVKASDLAAHGDGLVVHKPSGWGIGHVTRAGKSWQAGHAADGSATLHGAKTDAVEAVARKYPADRLTVAPDPRVTAGAMSDADLKSADQELARRASVLGKLGQRSAAREAVAAERQRRKAAAAPARKAGGAGKPPGPGPGPGEKAAPPAAARVSAGPAGNAGKALGAAIKSGVASRKAPGSAKVLGSQGEQGGTEVVTFHNGAQYIHKDFKGVILPFPESMGGPRPMSLQEKKLQVAKESLAARISGVIGAGAPAVLRDPHSQTGFYAPKIAGKSAMEHFSGRKGSAEKMYDSPEGMRIGLMDGLIGADDRHLGNVMITPDGKPVPIDHNDTWILGARVGRSPFAIALDKRIKAGKSPFSTADLDQVKAKIQALKPEFDAMPDGNGARYYQMTMGELTRIRGKVAGS